MAGNISIEGAVIGFRNFGGKADVFNRAGDRNFCVFLDPDIAEKLTEEGWNVKHTNPRDEDDEPTPYIQVAVKYGVKPPKIVLITSRGMNPIGEHEVGMLDWAEITHVDLTITPYEWSVNGNSGIKAYLKTMYVAIEEDEFEAKYADAFAE